MAKPQWRATALAIATAVLLGVAAADANALALGRVTVQSALGEPLRAEIDIPEITAEEIASLRTNVATPDAFKAAGIEYNAALSGLKIELARRPDGRHFLRLTTVRPVNDPFVDLILETTWSSGRVVRDYTMLFDPPSMRQGPAPIAAEASPGAAPAARQAPAAPARGTARAPSAAAPSAARAPAAAPTPSGDGKQVTVQGGDTAGKIAAANKPANVSLDQMLVAMLRANPDAFAAGNVNRLRAGAVIEVPSAEQAAMVPTDEAKQTLVAQSRDFNEFRRRLAEGVPTAKLSPSDRQVTGKITAKVEEKKPGAAAPDKLTLSKGTASGKAVEDKIARERAAKDSAMRVAEINKNIADLGKLGTPGTATGAAAGASKPGVAVPIGTPAALAKPASAPAPVAAASASKPAVPVAAPAPAPAPMAAASAAKPASAPAMAAAKPASASAPAVVAPPAVVAAPVPTPASAPAPAAAASAPAVAATTPASAPFGSASAPVAAAPASAPAAPVVAAPASAPVAATTAATTAAAAPKPAVKAESSFIDDMMDNPIIPASVGAVIAALLGFGFYRAQQRKKSTQVDSSFLESRLQPDSFFGASGGQRIDTNEGGATGSSMVYSPSQLDAAGDVDPVAEADVYLAYGRDLQAEEILKEAMRTQPQRVAIHSKLLEIYAKRRDAKAFEVVAAEAYTLTQGQGPEWEHICELGQELDPGNEMYRPGGHPSEVVAAAAAATVASANFGATQVTQAQPMADAGAPDVDLDLDFMLGDDEPAAAPAPVSPTANEPTQAMNAQLNATQPMSALDMDFGSATVALDPPAQAPNVAQPEPIRLDTPDLNIDENALSFDLDSPPPAAEPAAPAAAAKPAAESGMIEFDLGALSLDLPGAKAPAAAPEAAAPAAALPTIPTAHDEGVPSTSGAPLSTAGFDDTGGDPLATKLALAQEFNAIGDPDGARSLAQEVVAEASGDLKSAAQKFLAEIS